MQKVKQFFICVLDRLKKRWIGFYLLIPVVILSFTVPFVYMKGFFGSEYENRLTFAMPFLSMLFFAAAFFRPTAKYAPVMMFAMELASLLLFVKTTYMHLSTAFFGGISDNVFVQAGFSFSYCAMALLVNIVICFAAAFFAQYRSDRSEKSKTNGEVAV